MSHIHDKIDFTVEVFIVHEGTVLLRMHDKLKRWLSVGGHIELGEDPVEAAMREVREEVGLEVELWDARRWEVNEDSEWRELATPVAIARHRAMHPTRDDHDHVTFVYFAKALSTDVRVGFDEDRSDEWQWFDREAVEKLDTFPNVRTYALRALETLGSA